MVRHSTVHVQYKKQEVGQKQKRVTSDEYNERITSEKGYIVLYWAVLYCILYTSNKILRRQCQLHIPGFNFNMFQLLDWILSRRAATFNILVFPIR